MSRALRILAGALLVCDLIVAGLLVADWTVRLSDEQRGVGLLVVFAVGLGAVAVVADALHR